MKVFQKFKINLKVIKSFFWIALGLCKEGEGHLMVERGDNTYGGKYVINPSGGLISKGNPLGKWIFITSKKWKISQWILGATGIAQCTELCWQLRGEAGKRQVKDAKIALQQNIGLGNFLKRFPGKILKKILLRWRCCSSSLSIRISRS